MPAMPAALPSLREQLDLRRERLESLPHDTSTHDDVQALLGEIDSALARLDDGSFGRCDACHDELEGERLAADPLLRLCLDCLSPGQRRHLEDDLERAAGIQAALLPPRRLNLPGWDLHYHYEPAGAVSGDVCDVIPPSSPGGDTWFLLGDVSGKGVAASLLMSNLHAIFRGLLGNGSPLAEAVAAAGRLFAANTLPGHYATLIAGRASADGGLELVSAGHVPPLLRHDGAVSEAPLRGLPLGLFPEAHYHSWTTRLGSADALVLYTDGLTEASDARGEHYGVDRARKSLAALPPVGAEATTLALLEDLGSFRSPRDERDDLTVMTLSRL